MERGEIKLMGAGEIAVRLRLSRQRVYQLVNRKGFPDPLAHLTMGQVWLAQDVEAWIREHRPELDEEPEGE
jgi:prophage regulatory protein